MTPFCACSKLAYACMFLADVAFIAYLILAAQGWATVRFTIHRREREVFGVCYALFLAFDVQLLFCTSADYCNAVTLGTYVVKFLLTFGIVVLMNGNIEWLRGYAAQATVRENETASELNVICVKIDIFTYARTNPKNNTKTRLRSRDIVSCAAPSSRS